MPVFQYHTHLYTTDGRPHKNRNNKSEVTKLPAMYIKENEKLMKNIRLCHAFWPQTTSKGTKKKNSSTKRNFKDFSKSNNHKQHRVEQTRLQVISLRRKHIERAFAYRLLLKWDRFTRVKNAFHILSHKEKRLSFYNGYKSWQNGSIACISHRKRCAVTSKWVSSSSW